MFRGEDDRFSHCSDPSACLELAEKARNNDKMLKLYVTRLRDDILSRLMEKLNIKRVISMQKTKTNSALGFKQRPLLRKSPSLTLRIGRRLFSENSYKIRAMSNRPNSNVLFIMLMVKEILRVMIYWMKFCHADNSMQISEESERSHLAKDVAYTSASRAEGCLSSFRAPGHFHRVT